MDNEGKECIVACVENEITNSRLESYSPVVSKKEAAKVKDEDEEMVESDHAKGAFGDN